MAMTRHLAILDVDDLSTVRDLLRFGVSAFTRAGLVYGHGTSNPLDEAAFLMLVALDLPHDSLGMWVDCRLTAAERRRIAELFAKRIATRKPASYLVNTAFIKQHRFYVDERVIVPRSYIGELLADGLGGVVPEPESVTRVLDMCTGSGCLAIIAASVFEQASVDAVEISEAALDVARRNVAEHRLQSRVRLFQGNLFEPLGSGDRYDLILANPPYVAAAEVAAFDPEYAAEPVLAHAGGENGLDLVHRIVRDAAAYLEPGGVLVVEIGTGRQRFEAAYPDLEVMWLDTEASEGEVFAVTADALKAGIPTKRGKSGKSIRGAA